MILRSFHPNWLEDPCNKVARDAIARNDRTEVEVFVVPGGNYPTMSFISDWERGVGKPVITSHQAALWAMLQVMRADESLSFLGPFVGGDACDVRLSVTGQIPPGQRTWRTLPSARRADDTRNGLVHWRIDGGLPPLAVAAWCATH